MDDSTPDATLEVTYGPGRSKRATYHGNKFEWCWTDEDHIIVWDRRTAEFVASYPVGVWRGAHTSFARPRVPEES